MLRPRYYDCYDPLELNCVKLDFKGKKNKIIQGETT